MEYNADQLLARRVLEMKLISEEQLKECRKIQSERARSLPLAFILIEKGYLNDENLERVVQYQKNYFRYLSKYDLENLISEELIEMGIVTAEQLKECQEAQSTAPFPVPLVFILGEKGYLTEETIHKIVGQQTNYFEELLGKSDKKFGEICFNQGWITRKQLKRSLNEQKKRRAKGKKLRLGKILVNYKAITEDQIYQALELQGKKVLECGKCKKSFNVSHFNKNRSYPCPSCSDELVPKSLEGTRESKKIQKSLWPSASAKSQRLGASEESTKVNVSKPEKKSGYEDLEREREISKAVIVIEHALEESSQESEDEGKEDKPMVSASTTWWMVHIDDILNQKERDPKKSERQKKKVTSPIQISTITQYSKKEISPIYKRYFLAVPIGIILFLMTLILLSYLKNKSYPQPLKIAEGTPNEVYKNEQHKEDGKPPINKDEEDTPGRRNLPVGGEPQNQPDNVPKPPLVVNDPVKDNPPKVEDKSKSSFGQEIQKCNFSPEQILAVIEHYINNNMFQPDDIIPLRDIYAQFPQNKSLRHKAIQAMSLVQNDQALITLEEILQIGSSDEKQAAINALENIKGEKVANLLFSLLKQSLDENVIRDTARALSTIDPQNSDVFQEVSLQFYKCKREDVRANLIDVVSTLNTGLEGNFFIKIVSDRSIPTHLREMTLRRLVRSCLDENSKNSSNKDYYRKELERMVEEESEENLKTLLRVAIKVLSPQ